MRQFQWLKHWRSGDRIFAAFATPATDHDGNVELIVSVPILDEQGEVKTAATMEAELVQQVKVKWGLDHPEPQPHEDLDHMKGTWIV